MKKKIAIIGAGIAGLTFGNLLKNISDFDFVLYEKEDQLSLEEGFGIQLGVNSIKILNQIGFQKINSEKIFNPNTLNFYTINKEKICDLNLATYNSQNIKYTTLQRSSLIEFLINQIYKQHIQFGKRIKATKKIKGKILINFEDNTNDLVDYVVAADGLFSNTRSFFESKKNQPKFKNAIAIRTILGQKNIRDIDNQNISLLMGSGLHLVLYPINKKKDFNLVCIIRNRKFDPDKMKLLIEKKILSQNPTLNYLFQGKLSFWPLYSSSKIMPSSLKNVFYIGDAFNGFLPTLAQGASQSIESAYELFSLIKKDNQNINTLYFDKRSSRVKAIIRRSNLNFFGFHVSNFLIQKIRNFCLRSLVKSKRFRDFYMGRIYKN